MTGPLVCHLVGTNCDPQKEWEFNVWYTTHHAPLVLRGPATAALRYQRLGDDTKYPKFLVSYEYENKNVFNDFLKSPLHQEVLDDQRDSWPEAGEYTEVWSVAYERVAKRGNGVNPLIIHLMGTNCPANTSEADYDKWYTYDHMVFMLRSPYIVESERFHRIGEDTSCPKFLAVYKFDNELALAESKKHFLAGLSTVDRRRYWPDWVWRRVWGRIYYKLMSKERKDLVV